MFVQQFQTALHQEGFNAEVFRNLPATAPDKRKGHSTPQADVENDTLSQTSTKDRKAIIINFLRKLFK